MRENKNDEIILYSRIIQDPGKLNTNVVYPLGDLRESYRGIVRGAEIVKLKMNNPFTDISFHQLYGKGLCST